MKFIKPISIYIFLTLILFIGSSYIWQMTVGNMLADTSFAGYPIHFYTAWGPCAPGQTCTEFSPLNLILDFIFWLIIGAILVELYKWLRAGKAREK